MSSSDIKTFQQCLTMLPQKEKKHLLIGNGFSMDLFPKIFNYQKLAEKVRSEKLKQLFASMKTNDFEFVMYKLTEALKIVRLYNASSNFVKEIEDDLNDLKYSLIEAINVSHPENPGKIEEFQYESCRLFLSNFNGKKYSFNYDLLLYWVYMHFFEHTEEAKRLGCDDGFRHPKDNQSIVHWEIGNEHTQDIYYIHGALHLFSDETGIEKYTWINNGKSISTQVSDSINNGKYPLFISEGTKEHKLSRIRENSYLGRSFSSMRAISGNLFIFGHSLRDEDDHVFEILNGNTRIKKFFISLFGDSSSTFNQKILNKIRVWKDNFPNREYHLFDASTANVWGKND